MKNLIIIGILLLAGTGIKAQVDTGRSNRNYKDSMLNMKKDKSQKDKNQKWRNDSMYNRKDPMYRDSLQRGGAQPGRRD